MTDVTFVRVKEGFVVTSWGDVTGVEGLREGEDVGLVGGLVGGLAADPIAGPVAAPVAEPIAGPVAGPIAGEVDGESDNKRKKAMVKLKFTKHMKPKVGVGEDPGDGDKKDEVGGLADFVDAQSSPEPVEKRQKIVDTAGNDTAGDGTAAASLQMEANAAARSVALGLRTRK